MMKVCCFYLIIVSFVFRQDGVQSGRHFSGKAATFNLFQTVNQLDKL